MKCKYCGDPILCFQDSITIKEREGKREYHKGCYEIMKEEGQEEDEG